MAEKTTVYQQTIQNPDKVPPYTEFCRKYQENKEGDGRIGRKVAAIPMALYSATLPPLYHLVQALWTLAKSIYQAVLQSPKVRKAFNTIDQDFFKAWGYLTTFTSDCYGLYWVESSSHQQTNN